MSITRYTDPVQQFRIKGVDLTGADQIIVTFAQGNTKVTAQGNDVVSIYDGEYTILDVSLSQEQTSKFKMNKYSQSVVLVQVNWLINGRRNATRQKYVTLNDNQEERIIR